MVHSTYLIYFFIYVLVPKLFYFIFIILGEHIQNFETSEDNFDGTNISLCFIVSQLLKLVNRKTVGVN